MAVYPVSTGSSSLLNSKMWPTGRSEAEQQQEVKERGRPSPGTAHRSLLKQWCRQTDFVFSYTHLDFRALIIWRCCRVDSRHSLESWLQFINWQSDSSVAPGPVQETRAQGEAVTNCTRRLTCAAPVSLCYCHDMF